MAGQQGAMFDEFVQGGLLDDAQVTVLSARFATWDYRGQQPAVLALQLKLQDTDGKEHEEYLSAGELKFFVPGDDGKKAVPVGSQTKLNSNTNAAAFIMSLYNADTKGELAAKVKTTDDISILDGNVFHVIRKDQPRRNNLPQQMNADGTPKRPAQRLEVEKVVRYAWETNGTSGTAKAAPAASAPAAATAPAPAATGGIVADDEIVPILFDIINAAGGSIKKSAVAGKVFGNEAVKSRPAPEKNAILARIVKDDLINAAVAAFGLTFDGTTIAVAQ